MLGFSTDIKWHSFHPDRITITESRSRHSCRYTYLRHCVIESAEILGFCTIRDNSTDGKITQRVVLDLYDEHNVDAYICIEATDFRNRGFHLVVPILVDKFAIALARSVDVISITNEEALFTQGKNPLYLKDIGVEDMDFLKLIIHDWLHNIGIAVDPESKVNYQTRSKGNEVVVWRDQYGRRMR